MIDRSVYWESDILCSTKLLLMPFSLWGGALKRRARRWSSRCAALSEADCMMMESDEWTQRHAGHDTLDGAYRDKSIPILLLHQQLVKPSCSCSHSDSLKRVSDYERKNSPRGAEELCLERKTVFQEWRSSRVKNTFR